jgi:septal ring factor EnvC (AmiA/AmiB activator)
VVSLARRFATEQIGVMSGDLMIERIVVVAALALLISMSKPVQLSAQDVPGIEVCTVEKTMERRTSCLQSNVDFLQKKITKLSTDYQQRLDAATRQIEALKAAAASLQKNVQDLQAEQAKMAEDLKKKADAPPAKAGAPPPAKETAK